MKISELTNEQRRKVGFGVFAPVGLSVFFAIGFILAYTTGYGVKARDSEKRATAYDADQDSFQMKLWFGMAGISLAYGAFRFVGGRAAMRDGVCVPGRVSSTGLALLETTSRNVWVSYAFQGHQYELKTSQPGMITNPYFDDKQMIVVVRPGKPKAGIPVWSDWPTPALKHASSSLPRR